MSTNIRYRVLFLLLILSGSLHIGLAQTEAETKADSLTGASTDTIADTLSIDSLMHDLPEVFVTGQVPIVKAERGMLTYNMKQLMKQMPADNAYEALSRIPGISDADGSLKMAGSSITLVIDGKPTTLTQEQLIERLKALPADRLARTELMLAAPARFHVRGLVLNIVTTKARDGELSGLVTGAYTQSHYGSWSGKGWLSWQKGKFGMDAQYGIGGGDYYGTVKHSAEHLLNGTPTEYSDRMWQKSHSDHDQNWRLGINYAFADKHSIDVAYTGSYSDRDAKNHTTGTVPAEQKSTNRINMHNVDLNYSLPFGLQINGSYTHYSNPQEQLLESNATGRESVNTQSEQTIDKWQITVDQEHSLGNGWGLSYGGKFQQTRNNSYQSTLDKDGQIMADATSSVDIDERIWNVYAGFSKQLTEAISLEASVTVEQYHSPIWDKWRFYPVVNALWVINSDHILNLSFSSNSEFPDYWATMNSVYYSSTYTEVWGNPTLQPSSNYNTSLVWQYKRRYTLMAVADINPDFISQLPYQPTDRLAVIMQHTNFDCRNKFGLRAMAAFNIGQYIGGNVFVAGLYNHDKSTTFFDLPFDRNRLVFLAGSSAYAKLCTTQNLRLMLYPFIQTKSIQGVYDILPVFRLNAELRWASQDGKWNVSLQGSNLSNNRFKTRSVQGNQDFHMNTAPNWISGTLSVSYKFGNYKEKNVKAVDTSRMGH